MQINFNIEVNSGKTDSFDELSKILEEKKELQNQIAHQFALDLKQTADKTLHSTKDAYAKAITVNGETVTLDTSQFVVGMVENGVPSFDMKPGLLNSPKTKVSKNGQRYIVVPLDTVKNGKYNWRDQETGKFKQSTSGVKGKEFRVVSDKSSPDSWIHPGYQGHHFVDQTLTDFDEKSYDQIIDKEFDKIFR